MISFRSDIPHIVQPKENGQYACDTNCPQWLSSWICAHTVAVAEVNNSLKFFLEWYVAHAPQLNLTILSMTRMPAGKGRKKSPGKRSQPIKHASPDCFVASPFSLACPVPTNMSAAACLPCISTTVVGEATLLHHLLLTQPCH